MKTVAGGGVPDNLPANTGLGFAQAVAVDTAGNVFIAIPNLVLELAAGTGVLKRVAGTGTPGFSGDNGAATSARLNTGDLTGTGIAVDSSGNLYIADYYNQRIRKVSNGLITTIAGTGKQSFDGDDGPAISAQLCDPFGIAVDNSGNVYFADVCNHRIRRISNGVITTVVGTGTIGFSGDNGPATSAQLSLPSGVAVDSSGNLYLTDGNSRIRKVANGVITTVAGGGFRFGLLSDNYPAVEAQLRSPQGVAVDSSGNLYIADTSVRQVSNGIISTVPGVESQMGIAVDASGNLFVADVNHFYVKKVSKGIVTTVAGNGTPGFLGDNGPATNALLSSPTSVALGSSQK